MHFQNSRNYVVKLGNHFMWLFISLYLFCILNITIFEITLFCVGFAVIENWKWHCSFLFSWTFVVENYFVLLFEHFCVCFLISFQTFKVCQIQLHLKIVGVKYVCGITRGNSTLPVLLCLKWSSPPPPPLISFLKIINELSYLQSSLFLKHAFSAAL